MNHVLHPSTTHMLGAPLDWEKHNPHLDCDSLPITREYFQDGVSSHPVIKSFWLPTPEELAVLNAGGSVVLVVFGNTHPPVMLEVDSKQEEEM